MGAAQFREIKPTSTLPPIVALLETRDGGPCDDGHFTAVCPHCGAEGRYVHVFICEDGTRRGAMSGCIKLFPKSRVYARQFKLATEAFERQRSAREQRRNLAAWWDGMIASCEALAAGEITVEQWGGEIMRAEAARQTWLARKGYGRHGRAR